MSLIQLHRPHLINVPPSSQTRSSKFRMVRSISSWSHVLTTKVLLQQWRNSTCSNRVVLQVGGRQARTPPRLALRPIASGACAYFVYGVRQYAAVDHGLWHAFVRRTKAGEQVLPPEGDSCEFTQARVKHKYEYMNKHGYIYIYIYIYIDMHVYIYVYSTLIEFLCARVVANANVKCKNKTNTRRARR